MLKRVFSEFAQKNWDAPPDHMELYSLSDSGNTRKRPRLSTWKTILDEPPAGALVTYHPNFLPADRATAYMDVLLKETDWQDEIVPIYSKEIVAKRKIYHYGDNGMSFCYAGKQRPSNPWTSLMLDLKTEVEATLSQCFNYAVVNLYRDGSDYIGWHSDSEKAIAGSTVASLSFGASRDFDLRRLANKEEKTRIQLDNGDMLVMARGTQPCWQHCVPTRLKVTEPWINITLRQLATSTSL